MSLYIDQGTKARMIHYGEIVEIVYQTTNFGVASSHPMHSHGFSFYLVETGSGNFNNVTDHSFIIWLIRQKLTPLISPKMDGLKFDLLRTILV
ncbi:hypothetical protein Patl1_07913 [Pistacia atlantica]|uniref:Uncharacterized protein n=1 Tax=Pistacia atlantica TaxID=434234 RepID=A0ACC1AE62_9ROSI|nr:hypothetical protein Patl1_07913 [Pistacia atlantica]